MKMFWMLGCLWGAINHVNLAVNGDPKFAEWAGVAVILDWMTVVGFALAFIGAIRANAPWFSLWQFSQPTDEQGGR